MDLATLKEKFFELYGSENKAPGIYFAPGRVNLIGEHTDYNAGFVFPCALHYGTYLLLRKNDAGQINLASTGFKSTASVPANDFRKNDIKWVNYPLGVLDQLRNRGLRPAGMDMLFSGDVPSGAGLSSSASIEMVTAVAANEHLSFGLDMIDLIKLSQKAENEFVGVNCGIMDQFASGMGRQEHAVFLNCRTLEYEQVPLVLGNYQLVISNTNKKRGLTDSKYNERRSECDKAVEYLSKGMPISFLGELSFMQYLDIQHLIPDELVRRRAHHVLSENQRVLDAVKALKDADLHLFGNLMNASHDSLRDDYEVTGIELDTMVEEARKINGVIGSRMTGAGFGGCTVSLVQQSACDAFVSEISSAYRAKTGLLPEFYMPEVGDGARRLE